MRVFFCCVTIIMMVSLLAIANASGHKDVVHDESKSESESENENVKRYDTEGDECERHHSACPLSCFFHGSCNEETGECACNPGYTGDSCTGRTCEESECSIHGDCCESGCCCHVGWTGPRCEQLTGILPFSQPVCTYDGECVCDSRGGACGDNVGVDLTPLRARRAPFIEWTYFDECHCALDAGCLDAPGLRKILRFDTYTHNKGNADLFLGNPAENWRRYSWHVCHKHPHLRHWTTFRLRNVDTGEVALGTKSGSTILDSLRVSGSHTRYRYREHTQGIQAGWADWYPYYYDCQWIDVTDMPYGHYVLEFESNPLRVVHELDYSNNLLSVDLGCSCGEHGQCDFGTCACDDGWQGSSCAVRASATACISGCRGRSCGPDPTGCKRTCGSCHSYETCGRQTGTCRCQPNCIGKECGRGSGGGCGDSTECGLCLGEFDSCSRAGACQCSPSCRNRECGSDGCGGSCGTCSEGNYCDDSSHRCRVCSERTCRGRECGSDGCGGTCGTCSIGTQCDESRSQCVCEPDCAHRDCGADPVCGQSCGRCVDPYFCNDVQQCECRPKCGDFGRECGPDSCGGTCGQCPISHICTPAGRCMER
jgi:Lysyl oxidase